MNRKIRFLRDFTSTQTVSITGVDGIVPPVKSGEAVPRSVPVVVEEEVTFEKGEEVTLLQFTVEDRRLKVVVNLDARRPGAILDEAREGEDFEFIE